MALVNVQENCRLQLSSGKYLEIGIPSEAVTNAIVNALSGQGFAVTLPMYTPDGPPVNIIITAIECWSGAGKTIEVDDGQPSEELKKLTLPTRG